MKNPFQVSLSPASLLAGLLAASPTPARPAELMHGADSGSRAQLLPSQIPIVGRPLELERTKTAQAAQYPLAKD